MTHRTELARVIVRTTPSGRLTFYTGAENTEILGEVWTVDRNRARKLTVSADEVERRSRLLPRGSNDTVAVLPDLMVDAIIRWERDDRSRQRRLHRANRAFSRF